MKVYIILSLCLLFASCHTKKATDSASSFREKLYDRELIDSLNERVLNCGDTLAYFELQMIHYIGEQRSTGFLYHAVIMSNKYNYKAASNDVYEILMDDSSVLDDKTKEMANYYLLKSK